mgnify:CR=1 FL=1
MYLYSLKKIPAHVSGGGGSFFGGGGMRGCALLGRSRGYGVARVHPSSGQRAQVARLCFALAKSRKPEARGEWFRHHIVRPYSLDGAFGLRVRRELVSRVRIHVAIDADSVVVERLANKSVRSHCRINGDLANADVQAPLVGLQRTEYWSRGHPHFPVWGAYLNAEFLRIELNVANAALLEV